MPEGLLHKRALVWVALCQCQGAYNGGLCLRAIALGVFGQGAYDRGVICGVFCRRGLGLRGLCLEAYVRGI